MVLRSLFDEYRIDSGLNFEDFYPEALAHRFDDGRSDAFIGHMRWDAVEVIGQCVAVRPTVATFLRELLPHSRSQVAFGRLLASQGENVVESEGLEVVDVQAKLIAGDAFQPALDLYALIHRSPEDRQAFEAALAELRTVLFSRLADERFIVLIYEDQRRSYDLLSAVLGLPQLELPNERINASGAGPDELPEDYAKQDRDLWGNLFDDLYREGRRLFEERYARIFSGVGNVKAWLNARYRRNLALAMKPCSNVLLAAHAAWPGYGWSVRQLNEHDQSWRHIGESDTASLFVKLTPGRDYVLTTRVHSAPNPDMVGRIEVDANACAVDQQVYLAYEGNDIVRRQILPKAAMSPSADGLLELRFKAEPGEGSQVLLKSISID